MAVADNKYSHIETVDIHSKIDFVADKIVDTDE
jgi:hypothetical protein